MGIVHGHMQQFPATSVCDCSFTLYNDSKTIEIFKGLMPEMSHVGFICTASTIHIYFFSLLSAHYSEPHLNYRRLYVQMLVCDNALQIKKETFID